MNTTSSSSNTNEEKSVAQLPASTSSTISATATTNSMEVLTMRLRHLNMTSSSSSSSITTNDNNNNDILQLVKEDYDRILSVGEECINPIELMDLLLLKGRGSVARAATIKQQQSQQKSSSSTTSSSTSTETDTVVTTDNTTVPMDTTDAAIGFNLYDGFEPSGRMHIAQGIYKVRNVNKCIYDRNGATFIFWIADWFALMNDKMNGNLTHIQIVGQYLIEVWKAAGMKIDTGHVIFKWASSEITTHANTYWPMMIDIARRFTITRIKKCCQIMGRLENNLSSAQVLYPIMQCTDIFFLHADICQLGVDQRKVNMLAREYCDYAKRKYKPIILSHHMLYGLKQGQEKMSKSDPDSAIFMEDSSDDVIRKITNAYCPRFSSTTTTTCNNDDSTIDAGKVSMNLKGDTLKNPILDYIEHILFSAADNATTTVTFTVDDIPYTTFASVKDAFINGTISESSLKNALIQEINILLDPVRNHFINNIHAKQLLEQVQLFKKEAAGSSSEQQQQKVLRKCNLIALQKVSANSHVVLGPLPNVQPTIQEVMDVIVQLRQPYNNVNDVSQSSSSSPPSIILYLQDWTATVCNACNADSKGIMAYYTVLIQACKVLDPILMDHVQILYQSEVILSSDPSNYWISVINVGRYFTLQQVMGDNDMIDSDNVGKVIGRLMTVADIVSIEPSTVALSSKTCKTEASLIQEYYTKQLQPNYSDSITTIPVVTLVDCLSIRLQPPRDVDGLITENDEYYILDDPKVHGKSKMNKSFAEEKNSTFCPALNIASVFVFGYNGYPGFVLDNNNNSNNDVAPKQQLVIQRSDENGGTISYPSIDDVIKDYEDGSLHPGDLKKGAMIPIIMTILEALSNTLNNTKSSDKVIVQAVKTLKTLQKKKK